MPTTINGIGTWYYFKSKIQTRRGQCRHCAREAELKSYDTGLWFVVLYIPIIPLGKKRIVDECAVCQMHFAIPIAAWEKLSAQSIEEGMEEFKKDPSVETALNVHARLLAFGKQSEADAFRAQALPFFQSDHEFLRELAAQLDEAGRGHDAEEILHRVLAINPNDWNAREYLGSRQTDRGELDAARKKLDHLMRPGAGKERPMGPLARLAMALTARGRDQEALELYERSLSEAPSLGKDRAFRNACVASEKRAGRSLGLLPKRRPSWLGVFNPWNEDYSPGARQAAGWGVFLSLVAIGVCGFNEWVRRHRPLHLYNPFPKPMVVRIDDEEPISVEPGYKTVKIVEGQHRIETLKPIQDEHEFALTFPWWKRFVHNPFIAFSPRGSALAMLETVVYSDQGLPNDTPQFLPLDGVTTRDHVDYVMTNPPESLQVEGNNVVKRKTVIKHMSLPANIAASILLSNNNRDAALRLAEAHAMASPESGEAIELYRTLTSLTGREAEAAKVLERRLDEETTSIEWHRAWSECARSTGDEQRVRDYYDKRLVAAPRDARWLYLRGRLEIDHDKELDYFQRSIAADPNFGWPHLAIAFRHAHRAEWQACWDEAEQAERLKTPPQMVTHLKTYARWAVKDPQGIIEEAAADLEDDPYDVDAAIRVSVAGTMVDRQGGKDAWAKFEEKLRTQPNASPQTLPSARIKFYCAIDDWESADKEAQSASQLSDLDRAMHKLLSGRATEAAQSPHLQDLFRMSYGQLTLALAYELSGERPEAEARIKKAIEILEQQGSDEKQLAAWLRSPTPPSVEQIKSEQGSLQEKILIVAWLARRFPENAELAKFANELNVGRDPMGRFVARFLKGQGG